jgi:prevent-host-death family protein
MVMKEVRVNIAEAKAKLSQYVRQVKNGETILLCERNVPVAELRPLGLVEDTSAPYNVASSGKVRDPNQAQSIPDTKGNKHYHPAWGAMRGTVLEFPDDFNEPEGDVDWEAAK